MRQRSQVQPVGLELGVLQGSPGGIGMNDAEVSARPAEAFRRVKAQAFGVELKAGGQLAATKPARHGGQRKRFQCLAKLGVNARQRDIGGSAGYLPPIHVGPCPQAATASCDGHAQAVKTDVLVDAGHIDAPKLGVQLTRPVSPQTRIAGQEGLPENTAQAEAVTPFGGWRGVKSHGMAAACIADDSVHLV